MYARTFSRFAVGKDFESLSICGRIETVIGIDWESSREGKKIERRWTGARLGLAAGALELEQNLFVAVDYE